MDNKLKVVVFISAILLCALIVYAADFVPTGDINGKNIYNIKNFKDINGTNIYQSGAKIGNVSLQNTGNSIRDNSTCVIITGATTTMTIC